MSYSERLLKLAKMSRAHAHHPGRIKDRPEFDEIAEILESQAKVWAEAPKPLISHHTVKDQTRTCVSLEYAVYLQNTVAYLNRELTKTSSLVAKLNSDRALLGFKPIGDENEKHDSGDSDPSYHRV